MMRCAHPTGIGHDAHVSRPTILVLAAVGLALPAPARAVGPQQLHPVLRAHALEGHAVTVLLGLGARARRTVTVHWATRSGSAVAGRDFTAAEGTVTIPKGHRHGTLRIQTLRDHVDEISEAFTVEYDHPVGATLARTHTTVHVIDDNADIATVNSPVIHEPARSTASVPIGAVVRLRGAPLTHAIHIGYEIGPVELTADRFDLDISSGRLRFARGQRRAVIPGSVHGDLLDEGTEHFLIVLTGDRGVYARPGGTITITDDAGDTPPTVTIGDLSVSEGVSGAAQVPLTLTAPSEREVVVDYRITTGSADANDLVVSDGSVKFQPDTIDSAVPVALIDDLTDEPDQTFTVTITRAIAAVLGTPSTATVTILDNDDPPSVSIGDGTVVEGGAGALTVSLLRASEKPITVTPSVTGGTATPGSDCPIEADPQPDFISPPAGQAITFDPGQTQKTISVQTCDDMLQEGTETVLFGLADPVNAILGDAQGQLTITDNDP